MAGVVKDGRHAVVDLVRLAVRGRVQQRQRAIHVLHGKQRLDRVFPLPAFLAMPLLLERGVFRLNLGRVAKHQFHQIGRGRRGDDRAAKSLPHQFRGQSAMIDVGMGQQHGVEIPGPDRAGVPIAAQIIPLLKHPAIDQQPDAVGLEIILRTGYLSRGPQKLQFHG